MGQADLHQTYVVDTTAAQASVNALDETVLRAMRDVGRANASAATGSKKVSDSFKEAEKRIGESFKRMERDAKAWEKEQERAAKAAAAATKRALQDMVREGDAARAKFVGLGTSIAKVGAAISAALGGVSFGKFVKDALDYESAFAGVRKIFQASEPEFAAMSSRIRELSLVMPSAAKDIASVAQTAGQLGIAKESVIDFAKVMIDLGVTTSLTADQGSERLAQFVTITGETADSYNRIGSAIVQLDHNFATTAPKITEMALRLAGAGRDIGFTTAETLGLSAAIATTGIRAEAGGTGISRFLNTMREAAETSNENLAIFAKVARVTQEEFQNLVKTSPMEAFQGFIAGLGKVKEAGGSAVAVLRALGIDQMRERDAIIRLQFAYGKLNDALVMSKQAWQDNNALQKSAHEFYATTENQLILLKSAIQDIGITIGAAALPKIREFVERFRQVSQTAEFKAQIREATRAVGELADVLMRLGLWFVDNWQAVAAFGKVLAEIWVVTKMLTWYSAAVKVFEGVRAQILLTQAAAAASGASGIAGFAGAGAARLGTLGFLGVAGGVGAVAGIGQQIYFDRRERNDREEVARMVSGGDGHTLAVGLKGAREFSGATGAQAQERFPTLDVMRELAAKGWGDAQAGLDAIQRAAEEALAVRKQEADIIAGFDRSMGPQGGAGYGPGEIDFETEAERKAQNKEQRAVESWEKRLGLLTSDEIRTRTKAFTNDLAKLNEHGIKSGPIYEKFQKELNAFGQQARLAGHTIEDPLATEVVKAAAAIAHAEVVTTKWREALIETQMATAEANFASVEEEVLGIVDATEGLRTEMGYGAEVAKELGFAFRAIGVVSEEIASGVLPNSEQAYADLYDRMIEVVEAANRMGKEIPPSVAEAFDTAKLAKFREQIKDVFYDLAVGRASVGNVLGGIGSDLIGGLLRGKGGIASGGLVGTLVSGLSQGGGLGKLLSGGGLSSIVGGFTNKLAGSIVGPLAGFGSKAFPLISGALSGAMTMGIGTAVSLVAPKVFAGIKKLIGGKPEWQKIADDVSKNLGVSLSEGTAKAIEASAKQLGVSRKKAMQANLDKILAETTLSRDNFGKFATEALKAFSLVQSGGKAAAQTTEALKASYAKMIPAAEELGITGSKAFVSMIVAARKSGVEIPAAMEFTKKRLGEAVAGLQTFTRGLDDIKDPDRLAGITSIGSAVFDAFRSLPGGLRQAAGDMGESLDEIAKRYTDLGAEIPDALGHAIDLRNFAVNNEELLAGIQGLKDLTRGLGETGFMTADAFAAIGIEAASSFERLKAAGLGEKEALQEIAPVLQELVNEQLRNGQAVDATTQALIDQASAYGLVSEEGTGAAAQLTAEFDRLIDAIAYGFGVVMPESIRRGAKGAKAAVDDLNASVNTAIGNSSRLRYGSDESGDSAPIETHASGGVVGPGGGYAGAGEVVFSREAVASATGAGLLAALNSVLGSGGAAGGGGAVIQIIVEKEGTQEKVAEIRDFFANRLIRVPSAVVG